MFDLQQLRYFVAVAETQSIARAAERMHISQSPLSRQIIALEEKLHLELFSRAGKRLRLNAVGLRFLDDCQILLANAARLERDWQGAALGKLGAVHIAYVESAVRSGVLSRSLHSLRQQLPDVGIALQGMRSDAQFAAINTGEVDVGFCHRLPRGQSALSGTCVLRERYLLAVPSDHPLAKHKKVTAQALAGESFIFVQQSESPHGFADLLAACRQAGFDPDIRHQALEPSAVLELVCAGLGLAVVQASMQRWCPAGVHLMTMPASFRLHLEVYRVHREPSNERMACFLGALSADFPSSL